MANSKIAVIIPSGLSSTININLLSVVKAATGELFPVCFGATIHTCTLGGKLGARKQCLVSLYRILDWHLTGFSVFNIKIIQLEGSTIKGT